MPFVTHGGVRIHYEVEGTGPPLVLLHGRFVSLEIHRSIGLVQGLRDRYRLVLIDARGHGQSDKPHEPESYRTELCVGDVTAVLDDLGVRRSHCFGYSLGGRTCFGLAKYAPGRVKSLVIGGAGGADPDPSHPDVANEQLIRVLRLGREAWAARVRAVVAAEMQTAQRPSLVEAFAPMMLASEFDPDALIASMTWDHKEPLGMAEVFPHFTMPCFLFVGEADGPFEAAQAASHLIPGARFVSFPGLKHIETMMRVDLFLTPILGFLSDVDGRSVA